LQFTVNKKNILQFNDGFIFVIVIFFALFLRTFELNNRPMHTDEAVHAVKFGELLEDGTYIYNPIEYHGPTLNYFTLIPAILFGETTFTELNVTTLRLVPAIISLLLIIFFVFIFRKKEKELLFLISFLLTISPSFIFYSRYYIQETLLVTFTYSAIISFYKYWTNRNKIWIFLSGLFIALTFATKETSIITFASAIFAFAIVYLLDKNIRAKFILNKTDVSIFLFTSLFVSVLFYSSFFTNAQGIVDSVLTYANYFTKAGGNSEHINAVHTHPWFYYFDLMLYSKNSLILFTQIPLFVFTLIGVYFSFSKRKKISKQNFFRFLSLFSFSQAVIYSTISYKTPWLVLNFWVGFIILAGYGINTTFNFLKERNNKIIFTLLVSLIFAHNVSQTYLTSFKYSYRPENPFTYSQPTPEIITVAESVLSVAEANESGMNTYVNVISANGDYWPLPWYLRKLKNIAWNSSIPNSAYKFPIILATPNFEDELIQKLFSVPPPGKKNLYLPLFDEQLTLRPGVEIRGYVQKDFYDNYLRNDNETNAVLKGRL
jgi:uncharacterized protein (TIGR03663 family)